MEAREEIECLKVKVERLHEHLKGVEQKNARLKREVRHMQQKAEVFNIQIYATGLIVHCTGCTIGGPANYEGLTEDKVQEVEHIAHRLRVWWRQYQWRLAKGLPRERD